MANSNISIPNINLINVLTYVLLNRKVELAGRFHPSTLLLSEANCAPSFSPK